VNSRHGMTFSCRVQYKFNRSQWSSIKEILPPFSLVKNPDSLIITFDVNLRTQVLSRFRKSKRFEDTHNLINQLHEEGMGNKEISNYLNSHKIKTPTGKDYTRQLFGMYFYKSRKIERRLKHSELKLTNIRFWVSD
jgi:hypothetical protein